MEMGDITYRIRAAVFEVNKVLGAGFLEKVYEKALLVELEKQGLKARSQVPIAVYYKGVMVGEYFADVVVEDTVVLELKAVDRLDKMFTAQLLNYMKATGFKVGMLINFRYPKADIKRFILDAPEGR